LTCDETTRSECEKTEETLLTSWYPAVTAVFADKNITKGLKVKQWHGQWACLFMYYSEICNDED
jgi:hypothetical protein